MKVLIVDDEPLARTGLKRLLAREADVEIVGECDSAEAALAAIEKHSPDVIFLDVQMPGIDGMSLSRNLQQADDGPLIIFVTAFAEHAALAFEVHALDYVLKPVEARRLSIAVARARSVLQQRADDSEDVPGTTTPNVDRPIKGRVIVHTGKRAIILKIADIDWIEAAGNYVKIHASGVAHTVRESLASLEEIVKDEPFARIHRSAIVNVDSVKELKPWFSGEMIVVMRDGTELRLSRSYRRVFQQRLPILS